MKTLAIFQRAIKRALIGVVILSLIVPAAPAHAGKRNREYRDLCTDTVRDGQKGEQLKEECHKAKLVMQAKNTEAAKVAFLYTSMATAIVALVLEKIPYTSAVGMGMCKALDIGVPIATLGMEAAGIIAFKKEVNASTFISMASGLAPLAKSFSGDKAAKAGKAAGEAAKKGSDAADDSKTSSSCVSTIISIAIPTAMSTWTLTTTQKAFSTQLETIRGLKETKKESIADTDPNKNGAVPFNRGGGPQRGGGADTYTESGSEESDPCETGSYLDCLKTTQPEWAAVTADPAFTGPFKKAFGKDFNQVMNGIQGETPSEMLASLDSSLGLNGALGDAVGEAERAAEASNIKSNYVAMGYTGGAKATSSGGTDDAIDFNQLMANMLKNLDPEAAKEKNQDPSALVFRKLDLLPPERIPQNKDISLFARIGYRYQKKANHLEQLNWVRTE